MASKIRLRPVLMTSLTTILGLLPLAIGLGEGSELLTPLAITVMGGLTSSTFLTLVFIPALYLIVTERFEKRLAVLDLKPAEEPATASVVTATAAVVTDKPKSFTPAPVAPIPVKKEEEKPEEKTPPPQLSINFPVESKETIAETTAKEEKKEEKAPVTAEPAAELNPRQQQLLEKLKTLKKITRKEYAEMFNISIPTASRDLKELADKKMLRPRGPLGPGRWYEIF